MTKFKLNVTYYKILETVSLLNKDGFYPLNEGIYKIVTGKKDDETLEFSHLSTYSTLISYPSKKICNLTLMLFRNKYLEKVYDKNTDELYFKITKLGQDTLEKYLKRKRNNYSKKVVNHKKTIVKLP